MSKSIEALTKRVEDLKVLLARAEAKLASAGTVVAIATGSVVTFKYGRGETAVEKQGVVLGSKVAENGVTLLAIEVGSGFDKTTVRVPATAVKSVAEVPAAE